MGDAIDTVMAVLSSAYRIIAVQMGGDHYIAFLTVLLSTQRPYF